MSIVSINIPQDLSIPLYVAEIIKTNNKDISSEEQLLFKVKDRIYPIQDLAKDYYEVVRIRTRIGSPFGSYCSGELTCLNCTSRKCIHVKVCEHTEYQMREKSNFTSKPREDFPEIPYKQLENKSNDKLIHIQDLFCSSDFGYFRIFKNDWLVPTCLGSTMRMEVYFCIDCESTNCSHIHFIKIQKQDSKNIAEYYSKKRKMAIEASRTTTTKELQDEQNKRDKNGQNENEQNKQQETEYKSKEKKQKEDSQCKGKKRTRV